MLSEFPRPTIFMDNLLPLNAIGTILGVVPWCLNLVRAAVCTRISTTS